MDAETITMLRGSLEQVLATANGAAASGGSTFGDRLDELGWDEVVADDEAVALRMLFEVKGATRSSAPALDHVLGTRLAAESGDPELRRARFALGPDLHAAQFGSPEGSVGVDVVTLGSEVGETHIVGAYVGSDTVQLATVAAADVTVDRIEGLDPSLGLVRRTGTAAVTPLDTVPELPAELHALGRRCLGAELVGLSEVMLRDAVQYACDRRQYGRAIGSFQAVQHRLADARAALTGAAVVVEEAFADRSPWTATVAKALAGRGFEEVSRQCQQVYGAIGFTFEHDFHHFLRRGYLLDALLGDWRTLQEQVGQEIARTRTVPRIGSL